MLIAIAFLLSYLIAFIVAGHGGIPMGLVLVIGGIDSWLAPGVITGWIGITGLVLVTIMFRSNPSEQLTYQFFAALILYLSWLIIAVLGNDESGSLLSSFVLSAPFQITFFIVAQQFMLQRRQKETGSDSFP